MMAADKPKTAAGYSSEQTLACEQTLVNLLRGFGTLKDSFRLVGGLVPRYLAPEGGPFDAPLHAGTSDVDVVLNLQVLAKEGGYASLRSQLKSLKFEPVIGDGGRPVSWRWRRQISAHEFVVVEFLQDPGEEHPIDRRVAAVEGEDISACKIDHCGMVHEWFDARDITALLFDGGGYATETVRHADLVSFILLKALAIGQRNEPKDVGDLMHVLLYSGTIEDTAKRFAERWATGRHPEAFRKAIDTLRQRFCEGHRVPGHERDGCVQYGAFLHGDYQDLAEERMRAQLTANGAIESFLRAVAAATAATAATASVRRS